MNKFEKIVERIVYFRVFKRRLKPKYLPVWWCILGLAFLYLLKVFFWQTMPIVDTVVDKLNYIIWG